MKNSIIQTNLNFDKLVRQLLFLFLFGLGVTDFNSTFGQTCATNGQPNSSGGTCFCDDQAFLQTHDPRYVPAQGDPVKEIRVNFVVFQKPGFTFPADYLAMLENMKTTANWEMRHLHNQAALGICEQSGIPAAQVVEATTKIQYVFSPTRIVDDPVLWNNENPNVYAGCPDDSCFLDTYDSVEMYDNLNADERGINVYFTEYGPELHNLLALNTLFDNSPSQMASNTFPTLPSDWTYQAGASGCSMYALCEAKSSYVHMRNRWRHFVEHKWLSETQYEEDWSEIQNWYKGSNANLLNHEIGHTLFGYHVNVPPNSDCVELDGDETNNNNMMNTDAHGNKHILDSQLARAHSILSNKNIREFVVGCPVINRPFTIEGDEIWEDDRTMYQDIVIPSDSKLTLTCILRMARGRKIIVEKGGHLVVDGALITNSCDGSYWKGIQVMGTDDISNEFAPIDFIMGKAEVINGATIENALFGLRNYTNGAGTRGGLLVVDDAYFLNNRKDIEFHRHNFIDNSYINNAHFCVDNNVLFNKHQGISLWSVEGVGITNCFFGREYDEGQFQNYAQSASIATHGSSFSVSNSFFKQSEDVGIILNQSTASGAHHVDVISNDFIQCRTGIHSEGVDELYIYDNEFTNGGEVDVHILPSANSVICEYNFFTNSVEGFIASNTDDAAITVRGNEFDNNIGALSTEGRNNGFQFMCNDFSNNVWDVSILDGQVSANIPDQGFGGQINENLFTSCTGGTNTNVLTDPQADGTTIFTYNIPFELVDPRLDPVCDVGAAYNKQAVSVTSYNCVDGGDVKICEDGDLECIRGLEEQIAKLEESLKEMGPNHPEYRVASRELDKFEVSLVSAISIAQDILVENKDLERMHSFFTSSQRDLYKRTYVSSLIEINELERANAVMASWNEVDVNLSAFKTSQELLMKIIEDQDTDNFAFNETEREFLESQLDGINENKSIASSILSLIEPLELQTTRLKRNFDQKKAEPEQVKVENLLLQLEVAPNPASDYVRLLNVPSQLPIEIKMFKANGVRCLQTTANPQAANVDVSRFAPGIYYITASTNGSVIGSTKLIIQ